MAESDELALDGESAWGAVAETDTDDRHAHHNARRTPRPRRRPSIKLEPPTLNNATGQVINRACLTPSPTEQIAPCGSGS
jgi:hypothetical protein